MWKWSVLNYRLGFLVVCTIYALIIIIFINYRLGFLVVCTIYALIIIIFINYRLGFLVVCTIYALIIIIIFILIVYINTSKQSTTDQTVSMQSDYLLLSHFIITCINFLVCLCNLLFHTIAQFIISGRHSSSNHARNINK